MENLLVNKATNYADNGFSVIPVKSDKSPALRSWVPYQKKHMINGEIQHYFSQAATIGIAIVCGTISGNLEVIDVDLKYDSDNVVKNEFPELIKESNPELYNKLAVIETKNKGWHIPFRCEQIEGNQKLAKNKNGEVLIETRGEGGYVISPPTPGYSSLKKSYSDIPTITKEERELLLSLARSFDETEEEVQESIYGYPEDDEDTPFSDFNNQADIPKLLEENGWKRVKQRGYLIHYLRPDKSSGISANWHIKKRIFYNFSTSTDFEANKGYSASGVFTTLVCNGDFSLASQKLLEMGYGKNVQIKTKLPPTPLLPIEAFPESLQRFIIKATEIYQVPRDFFAGGVIMATALGIGDKLELVTKFKNVPILWMGILGEVSIGKTEPQKICLKPFSNLDAKLFKDYNDEIKEYTRLSKLSKTERLAEGFAVLIKPKRFQYLVSDYTPEALAKVCTTNNRGIIITRDELKGLFDDFGRYNKSGEESAMLSAFNQVDINIIRKTSDDVYIPKPVISIIGGLQPNILPFLAVNNREENGFLARFIFVYPDKFKRPNYHANSLPDDLYKEYEQFIIKLVNRGNKMELFLTNEAHNVYKTFYNSNSDAINDEKSGYLKGVFGKLDIVALRIAIVLKGMKMAIEDDRSNMVSEEIMKSAIEMTEYFRATALKVYHKIFGNDKRLPSKREVIEYLFHVEKKEKADIARIVGVSRQRVQNILRE